MLIDHGARGTGESTHVRGFGYHPGSSPVSPHSDPAAAGRTH